MNLPSKQNVYLVFLFLANAFLRFSQK